MSPDLFLFDTFKPGATLGQVTEEVSRECLANWTALYPWDAILDGTAPAGVATVLMMRAYLNVVTPRPPGNLHVRQRLAIHEPIQIGHAVTTAISCIGKIMKGPRRQVELRAEAKCQDGRRLYDGIITLYWAA